MHTNDKNQTRRREFSEERASALCVAFINPKRRRRLTGGPPANNEFLR